MDKLIEALKNNDYRKLLHYIHVTNELPVYIDHPDDQLIFLNKTNTIHYASDSMKLFLNEYFKVYKLDNLRIFSATGFDAKSNKILPKLESYDNLIKALELDENNVFAFELYLLYNENDKEFILKYLNKNIYDNLRDEFKMMIIDVLAEKYFELKIENNKLKDRILKLEFSDINDLEKEFNVI